MDTRGTSVQRVLGAEATTIIAEERNAIREIAAMPATEEAARLAATQSTSPSQSAEVLPRNIARVTDVNLVAPAAGEQTRDAIIASQIRNDLPAILPEQRELLSESLQNLTQLEVAELQQSLRDKGFDIAVDGCLGPETFAALQQAEDRAILSAADRAQGAHVNLAAADATLASIRQNIASLITDDDRLHIDTLDIATIHRPIDPVAVATTPATSNSPREPNWDAMDILEGPNSINPTSIHSNPAAISDVGPDLYIPTARDNPYGRGITVNLQEPDALIAAFEDKMGAGTVDLIGEYNSTHQSHIAINENGIDIENSGGVLTRGFFNRMDDNDDKTLTREEIHTALDIDRNGTIDRSEIENAQRQYGQDLSDLLGNLAAPSTPNVASNEPGVARV